MFTVLFAIGRTVGWVAHWKEMICEPTIKIGRPRQLYVGHEPREFQPVNDRDQTESEYKKTDWKWFWSQ
jgi:citrate synthase